jgi:hypothetical protein
METLRVYDEVTLFDFVFINLIADGTNNYKIDFLTMFSMILKEELLLSSNGYFFTQKGLIIDNSNFKEIIQIIRDQNVVKEREEKITTKKERDYKDMLNKAREKYKGYLKATGKLDNTDLVDIISAVSARHQSLNLLNIYELTVYQLIDQFKRLNLIDEYFINIKSLLAGADKKDVNLIHWSKKIID